MSEPLHFVLSALEQDRIVCQRARVDRHAELDVAPIMETFLLFEIE
jgi:hypothetical protein